MARSLSPVLDYQGDAVQSSLHFPISHLIFEMEMTSGRNAKLEVIKKAGGGKGGTRRLLFEFCMYSLSDLMQII